MYYLSYLQLELKNKKDSGEILARGKDDILSKALATPEASGRSRTYDTHVGHKKAFAIDQAERQAMKKARHDAQMKALETNITANIVKHLRDGHLDPGRGECPAARSSCGSLSVDGLVDTGKYAVDDITSPVRCKLHVPVTVMTHHPLVAALGMVQPPTDVVPQVDGVPLKPGFAMCFVDKVMPGFEGILLFNTCVDADVQSLGQAKLRYVQWPKKEISLLSAMPSTSTASRQMASSEGLRSAQVLLNIAAKQPSREQAVEDTTVAQSCEATPTPPVDGNSPTALVVNNTTNLVEATPTPPTPPPLPQPQQAYLPPPPQSQEAQLPSLPPQPQQAHLPPPPPPQLVRTRRGTTPVRAKDHAKMAPINRTPMKPKPKTTKNKKNTAPIYSDQYLDD